jgi:sulfite reductase (ferredoxin)
VRLQYYDVPDDTDIIIQEFRTRFVDTELFFDKYAGAKFARYLINRHEDADHEFSRDSAQHLVEEAQLFIEAAHACHGRILEQGVAPTINV